MNSGFRSLGLLFITKEPGYEAAKNLVDLYSSSSLGCDLSELHLSFLISVISGFRCFRIMAFTYVHVSCTHNIREVTYTEFTSSQQIPCMDEMQRIILEDAIASGMHLITQFLLEVEICMHKFPHPN